MKTFPDNYKIKSMLLINYFFVEKKKAEGTYVVGEAAPREAGVTVTEKKEEQRKHKGVGAVK